MPIVRVRVKPGERLGFIDEARVDATTEEEIEAQIAEDDAEARRDAARYLRRVRRRLGWSQEQLAERMRVSVAIIQRWERGAEHPTGAARTLSRVLYKAPRKALAALV